MGIFKRSEPRKKQVQIELNSKLFELVNLDMEKSRVPVMIIRRFLKVTTTAVAGLLLSGCGVVGFVETPEGYGSKWGEYGANEWVEINGVGNFPTESTLAQYCEYIGQRGGNENSNWTYVEIMQASDACIESYVDGLE